MVYRIEWIIEKDPKAVNSQDFYGYFDEYQNEFGNIPFETYKRYCRSAMSQLKLGAVQKIIKMEEEEENIYDGTEIKTYRKDDDKNELYIEAHSYNLRTIDDLITYAEIDTSKWECFKQVANKWGSFTNDCYQIKGWFRLKDQSKITPEEYAERFKELTENYKPIHVSPKFKVEKDILAEIGIFDFHFGQLIWGEAASNKNYDSEIAGEMFDASIDYFLNKTWGMVDKYLLPLGNDFFNSDSLFNTTTKGTPQHEDGYWKKTFIKAEELFIRNIDKLVQNAPIDILIIPGNHDTQRIFYMGQFLSAWYKDHPEVNIIISHTPRQYYVWGNNLIGFTHGDKELKNSLPMLMCQEVPIQFAETQYHEWHTGHFHSYAEKKTRLAKDYFGIREIILPTMIPTAEYAGLRGYMHVNEAICFIWDKVKGKESTLYYHP